MLSSFKISNGHNLILEGNPETTLIDAGPPSNIIIHPKSIHGIKPKLLVKKDDSVKIGTPLFFDKNNSDVLFVSTCSGKISSIDFGPRRIIESIHIENDNKHLSEDLDTAITRSSLLKAGLWSYIRQRPFSKIPKSDTNPKSIFISALSTAPFALDYDFLYKNTDNYLQSGIDVLTEIFKCDINFTSSPNSSFKELKNVNHFSFNKLHPAGNVGIQMHHIQPIQNADDTRWYVSLQDLNRIGYFFSQKKYPSYKYISVGGNGFLKPGYYKQLIGTPISKFLKNNQGKNIRIISGDVLSGDETNITQALNYYDEIVSIIKINNHKEFLGWLKPGFNKYSLSNTFLSKIFSNSKSYLDTKLNGSVRSIMPMGNWDKVLPMNILPEFLIKSILVKDIDMMEKLGIYESSPEDFALCSFVCQSKVEVSNIIKEGLQIIEEEI